MDSIFSSIEEIKEHLQYCPGADFEYRGFKGKIKECPRGEHAGRLYIEDIGGGKMLIETPGDVDILPDVDIDIKGLPKTSDSGRYPCQV